MCTTDDGDRKAPTKLKAKHSSNNDNSSEVLAHDVAGDFTVTVADIR